MKLKLFQVDQQGPTVVVIPDFDGHAFRYQDLQLDANAIRAHMQKAGKRNLIVDLSRIQYFGSEFISAMVSMLRETKSRGGQACFCAAHPQTHEVLRTTGLCKIWPHFESRALAIAAAQASDEKSEA
jgi:anti-sigma B factor antagonist